MSIASSNASADELYEQMVRRGLVAVERVQPWTPSSTPGLTPVELVSREELLKRYPDPKKKPAKRRRK